MKKALNTDSLKIIYQQYKDYLLPSGIIVVCLILFFYLIIPQLLNFSDLQKQMDVENQKLTVLKNNLNYLSSVDEGSLSNQYKITTSILPKQKDFASVLNAVSVAAGKASVSLGDFEFQVGDLLATTTVKGYPFLELNLNLSGDVPGLVRFLDEIYKTAPVAEVTSLQASGESFSLTIHFYYQAIPPVNLRNDSPIKAVSAADQNTITQISAWNNLGGTANLILPQSTTSGSFNSGPFQ